MKKRQLAKKTLPKDIKVNLSGVKFEDALRVMLKTPAMLKPKK